jgi:hypothetical protein
MTFWQRPATHDGYQQSRASGSSATDISFVASSRIIHRSPVEREVGTCRSGSRIRLPILTGAGMESNPLVDRGSSAFFKISPAFHSSGTNSEKLPIGFSQSRFQAALQFLPTYFLVFGSPLCRRTVLFDDRSPFLVFAACFLEG